MGNVLLHVDTVHPHSNVRANEVLKNLLSFIFDGNNGTSKMALIGINVLFSPHSLKNRSSKQIHLKQSFPHATLHPANRYAPVHIGQKGKKTKSVAQMRGRGVHVDQVTK